MYNANKVHLYIIHTYINILYDPTIYYHIKIIIILYRQIQRKQRCRHGLYLNKTVL